MSRTATYLYALLRDAPPPDLADAPAGLPGAGPPRLLEVAEHTWLVVADVPAEDYGEETIARGLEDLAWVSERALGHERLVEHLLDPRSPRRALVPLKLFTLFAGDERAVAWASGEAERLAALADRLAGRVELGVRLLFERGRAAGGAERPAAASGTQFLEAKRQRREARRDAGRRALQLADEVFAELSAAAAEARRLPIADPAAQLLLDAAFLVPAGRVPGFEERVDALARQASAAGCTLALTGPWPPYNFVEGAR